MRPAAWRERSAPFRSASVARTLSPMSLRGALASGGLPRLRRGLWAAVFLLCASPAAAQPAAPADMDRAKQHMQAGAAFYNDPAGPKCEEALVEFTKAYELSGSTRALRAMGVCSLELERDGEAIEQFEAYLAKAKDAKKSDRAQVESDLAALKSAVARVTFTSDATPVRLVAVRTPTQGSRVTNRYMLTATSTTLGLHPGAYEITASVDGRPEVRFSQEIPHGGALTRALVFTEEAAAPPVTPPPTDEEVLTRPVPVTAIVFGGLAVALTVPAVVFGVRALGKGADFDEKNGKAPVGELSDLRDQVLVENALTDAFAVGAVACAAIATVFFFTRPEVRSESTQVGVSFVGETKGLVVRTTF